MYTSIRIFTVIVSAFIWVLAACSADPAYAITQTPSDIDISTTVFTSPVSQTARELAAISPEQTQGDPPVPSIFYDCEDVQVEAPVTRHTIIADLNVTDHVVTIQQTIHYINTEAVSLDQLILNIEPNRWNNVFSLNRARIGVTDLEASLDGKRLTLTLPEPLVPNCEATVILEYRLDLPLIGEGIYASYGYFGYTNRQLNLGHWLATVAPRRNEQWISRQSFLVGEQDVLDQADWDVTLSLIGAGENLTIAAPGTVTQLNEHTYRFVHRDARDFALSMSDSFNIISAQSENNITVEVYSFSDAIVNVNGQSFDTAQIALETAVHAVETYSDLFGEYPYERLVIVQGDFPDGMEFSGLAYVGGNWFVRYPGNPASYLVLITAHEVAHQWWYGRTGNDSASTPWLDEAFATYSEYIFLEEHYPDLRDWWWQFRVNNFSPLGDVDSTVYEFGTARDYINAVYLRGALMLHAIRQTIGTEDFFDLLNTYADVSNGQIADAQSFWSLMTEDQLALTQAIRTMFLESPNVISVGG
ncbi:MAG: M1 family metallopeptidase [Aggregatilineales bacterium]